MNDVLARVAACLARGPRLRLAAVFGSRARGREHSGSDLDLAIWPVDPDLSLADELQLASELERELGCAVDLLRLDVATTLVRWEVARQGIPVLVESRVTWSRFVARAASEWADFRPSVEEAARRFSRRLIEVAR